jgi:transposase
MSARRKLSMRKIKEIVRMLLVMGLTIRQIARSTGVARSTVAEYVRRARQAKLSWEVCNGLEENDLERLLFPPAAAPEQPAEDGKPIPDWLEVHRELQAHKHLTITLLWQEYKEQHPEGYSLSRYHELYSRWRGKLNVVMRQVHHAGEKLFVDFCDGPRILLPSGETQETYLFVAVWGASNYTFVRAVASQDLPNWIECHVAAFEYFDRLPVIVVPDNLRSGVSKACRYEPDLNPTYLDMAQHYKVAVIPARPYKARDKAKVEAGVLLAQRWILAKVRKRIFHSVDEINAAIAEPLDYLNEKPQRVLKKSRKELFETMDRPAANALPPDRYEYAIWKKCRVGPDYHLCIDDHYYSVPYQLIGDLVEYRLTTRMVEVVFKGRRVASHIRSFVKGGKTTCPEHMPKSHQEQAKLSVEAMQEWAAKNGPATRDLFEQILIRQRQSESALHSFVGIFRLANRYGQQRAEKAAQRALVYGNCSYQGMKMILSGNLDKQPLEKQDHIPRLPAHENIRGGAYFMQEEKIV